MPTDPTIIEAEDEADRRIGKYFLCTERTPWRKGIDPTPVRHPKAVENGVAAMTDPTEAEIEAARVAYINADGYALNDWLRAALLAAAKVRGDGATETLPCDVMLPPATRISAGCSVQTLLTAIGHRRERPPQPFTVFDRAEKAEAERDTLDALRDEHLREQQRLTERAANAERELDTLSASHKDLAHRLAREGEARIKAERAQIVARLREMAWGNLPETSVEARTLRKAADEIARGEPVAARKGE